MPQSLTASEDPAVTTDAGLSSSRPLQPSTSINLNSQRPSSLFQQRSGEGSKTSSRELTSLASPVIGQLSKRSSGAAPPEVPRPLARQSQPFGNSRQGSTPGNLHAARQQASRGSMPGSPLSARRRSQSFSVVGDHSAPASPRSPLSVRQASEQVGSVRMAPRKPSGLVPLAQDDLARRVSFPTTAYHCPTLGRTAAFLCLRGSRIACRLVRVAGCCVVLCLPEWQCLVLILLVCS